MTSSRRQGRSLWVLGCSLLLACSEPPIDPAPLARATPRPLPRAPVAAAIELGTAPLALDERGVPHLLRGASAPAAPAVTATESARQHVARLAPAWGVDQLPQLEPIGEVPVDGGAIARLRQSIDGLPIEGGELRVLVGRNGELTAVRGALYDATTPRTAARFLDEEASAVARAVRHRYGATLDPRALASHFAADGTRRLAGRDGEIEVELATARKVWHRAGDALIAAWKVEAYTSRAGSTDGDAHATLIAADDGRVLDQRSLTADAAFRYRVFAETTGELHPFDGPTADPVPHPTGVPDGSYPSYVPPSLVTVEGLNHPAGASAPDPWLAPGATETRGNNVDAYADFNPPSGLSAGDFRATATSPGTFDRTYDTALGPMASQSQQMAAVTSLFYVINWLHDFWYDAGFTEAAGNAQAQNYGRGGVEGDALLAEAQDNALGGSRNNANMSTPSDGMPPRMQVFLWSGPEERSLTLTPSNRTPAIDTAGFGPTSFDRTAQLILANDGTGNPSDACTALVGTYTGRIVLADRGSCTYENKALMVQNAGGVGLIVADNQASTTPPSLGDDSMITTPITIGAVSVTMAEGARIKTDLAAGAVQARIFRNSLPELDGALDSTLIAHEFGHYLHHRLSECNTTWCRAMSEGWGDFTALMLQLREGDDLAGAYPFSVYTTQSFTDDPGYFGIRRAPYSVDFAKNSLSYRHMAEGEPLPTHHPFLASGNNAEVHNAGEVWAAALWEVYVALQQAGPSFEEVRSKMARYVVAGLMMAPVDATPTETRDALLTVASEADRDLLAAAFARRGFGTCAITPARDSSNFVGIVESDQLGGRALTGQLALADTVESCDHDGVLDGGETGVVSVPLTNTGLAPLPDVTVSVVSSTPGLTVVTPPVEIASFAAGATEQIPFQIRLDDSAAGPRAGELLVTVRAPRSCEERASFTKAVRRDVDDVPAR
ncbi:MAG: M36 family metallopeptidase, partial [Kofleriaceae bacterium]